MNSKAEKQTTSDKNNIKNSSNGKKKKETFAPDADARAFATRANAPFPVYSTRH